MKEYTVEIQGRKVTLPVLRIAKDLSICFFNLHGNQELTEFCALHVANLLTDTVDASNVGATLCRPCIPEVIITAESKGLQLAHCVARRLNHPFYAVARKSKKLYMQDGIVAHVKSITTGDPQTLYLSAHDTELLRGKKVAIVDDVISTGGSVLGMEELVRQAGGHLVKKAFVLAEGDASSRTDIVYLATIPLIEG